MSDVTATQQEPPAKRQKKTQSPSTTTKNADPDALKEPKPRPIRHLDLSPPLGTVAATQKTEVQQLIKLLKTKKKIVVVAGAGISVGAGSKLARSLCSLSTLDDFTWLARC